MAMEGQCLWREEGRRVRGPSPAIDLLLSIRLRKALGAFSSWGGPGPNSRKGLKGGEAERGTSGRNSACEGPEWGRGNSVNTGSLRGGVCIREGEE